MKSKELIEQWASQMNENMYSEDIDNNSVHIFMDKFITMCEGAFNQKDIFITKSDKPNTLKIKFMNSEEFELNIRKL